MADSQIRRFATCAWEIQSKNLTYLANYSDHTRRIPEFHLHPLRLRICESANLPVATRGNHRHSKDRKVENAGESDMWGLEG